MIERVEKPLRRVRPTLRTKTLGKWRIGWIRPGITGESSVGIIEQIRVRIIGCILGGNNWMG